MDSYTTNDGARERSLVERAAGRLAVVVIMVAVLSAQSYTPADLDSVFERDTLVIRASVHACHRIDIWVASAREQQMRGLMFVRDLPPDAGMLFVYDRPGRRSMWMKNTYISLDMLFIRDDGSVASIVANTEPLSLRSISSIEPVTYVLELNAGAAEAMGIRAGDQIFWSGLP